MAEGSHHKVTICDVLPLPLQREFDCHAGIILTNDGNAILREIDVSHPAAKVLILQAV